jgi:hypothetical protein
MMVLVPNEESAKKVLRLIELYGKHVQEFRYDCQIPELFDRVIHHIKRSCVQPCPDEIKYLEQVHELGFDILGKRRPEIGYLNKVLKSLPNLRSIRVQEAGYSTEIIDLPIFWAGWLQSAGVGHPHYPLIQGPLAGYVCTCH